MFVVCYYHTLVPSGRDLVQVRLLKQSSCSVVKILHLASVTSSAETAHVRSGKGEKLNYDEYIRICSQSLRTPPDHKDSVRPSKPVRNLARRCTTQLSLSCKPRKLSKGFFSFARSSPQVLHRFIGLLIRNNMLTQFLDVSKT